MHRASRVLGNTTAHLARRPLVPANRSLVQRSFAAVSIIPVDTFAEVASSRDTTARDGSKDKADEDWQKMVEVRVHHRASAGAPVIAPSCAAAAPTLTQYDGHL